MLQLLTRYRSYIHVTTGPGRGIVTEKVQPRVDCEMVTKHSPIFFVYFDEYFVNLCNNSNQKYDFF